MLPMYTKDLFGNMLKRYQYLGKGGKLCWTEWYKWDSSECPKYQLMSHPKLLNEYKDETRDIPSDLLQGC